jgi:cation/acetate symporter
VDAGGNMAAPLLAEVLGGTGFLGFISAVAFATILAVVAGLTLSGAAALAHDLWGHVVRKGKVDEQEQLKVARWATVGLAILAILLGLVFQGQNVAFMVGLAFSIAASANFPALLLSMLWRRFSTRGAVASMVTGTVSSLVLITLSPTVWKDLLHNGEAIIPLKNPGIITVPLSFLVAIVVSLLTPEPDAQAGFDAAQRRMTFGPEGDSLPG